MLVVQTSHGVARAADGRYELLEVGSADLAELIESGATDLLAGATTRATLEVDEVVLRAPVRRPGKVVIVGLNYRDHAVEVGMTLPEVPRLHLAASSAVTGPGEEILLPSIAPDAVDYEGEMAIVIGATASEVASQNAWSHVAGVTAANDVSARDVQNGTNALVAGSNVGLAKAFDRFKPLGPALLTADELRDGRQLRIRTTVDGEMRQDSTTAEMHFPVPELVSWISRYMTLHPGDVILTGTPGGVGVTTGRFLRVGQIVEVDLEGVGVLSNGVAAAPPPAGSPLR